MEETERHPSSEEGARSLRCFIPNTEKTLSLIFNKGMGIGIYATHACKFLLPVVAGLGESLGALYLETFSLALDDRLGMGYFGLPSSTFFLFFSATVKRLALAQMRLLI